MQRVLQHFGDEAHPIAVGQTKLHESGRGGRRALTLGSIRAPDSRHSRDFVHRADDGREELVCHGPHVPDGVV